MRGALLIAMHMRQYTKFTIMALTGIFTASCANTVSIQVLATERSDIFRIYSNISAFRSVNPSIKHIGSPGINEAAAAIAATELHRQGKCLAGVEIYSATQKVPSITILERSNDVVYLVKCM